MAAKAEPIAVLFDEPGRSFSHDQPIQVLLNLLTQYVPSALPFSAYFSDDPCQANTDTKFYQVPNPHPDNMGQKHASVSHESPVSNSTSATQQTHFMRYGVLSLWCETCKEWFSTPVHLVRHDLAHEAKKSGFCKESPAPTPDPVSLSAGPVLPSSDLILPPSNVPTPSVDPVVLSVDTTMPFGDSPLPPINPVKPAECTLSSASHGSDINDSSLSVGGHCSLEVCRQGAKHCYVRKTGKCNVCDKILSQASKLPRHMLTHTGERPHQCDYCGKGFPDYAVLKRHKRTHTGVKPYQCNVCDKRFSSAAGRSFHKPTQSPTCERPYQCDICGKMFYRGTQVTAHKRSHTGEKPYKCNICGRDFAQSAHYESHMWKHTGVKQFTCDACGKTFTDYSNLVRHKRIHTGERPYTCDICNKAFNQSSSLKAHKHIHTKDRAA